MEFGRNHGRYWGPMASVGLALAVMLFFALLQTLVYSVAAALVVAGVPGGNVTVVLEQMRWSGGFFAFVLWISCPLALFAVLGAIFLKKKAAAREYLALCALPTRKEWLIWLGALLGVIAIADLTTILVGREVVPEFMRHVYSSAAQAPSHLIALWGAVVIAAPAFEEVLFRGFLFRGLESSEKVRPLGAILVTSVFWTGIHQQYGPYELAQVFALGVVIGLARWKAGSLWLPLAMHALANLIAMTQAALLL